MDNATQLSVSSLRAEQNLTEEQHMLISETLSNFDVKQLTEADALSIVEAFSQAGIQASATLEKTMAGLGFDAKSIGELAKVTDTVNRPAPPPKQNAEEITSMVDYLAELLKEKLAANNNRQLSDEDKQSILAQVFEKFNIEDGKSIINTNA